MNVYKITNPELFPSIFLGFVDPDDYYSYLGIITSEGDMRQYNNLEELLSHVAARREAQRLPKLPDASGTVQHYLYALGEAPRSLFSVATNRTFMSDISKGAAIALGLSRAAITGGFTAGSFGWVSKMIANKRASICAHCPKNVQLTKSSLVRFNDRIAGLFTNSRVTDFDDKLFDCEACGCPLAVKVHYSEEIIRANTEATAKFPKLIMLPNKQKSKCWIAEIVESK